MKTAIQDGFGLFKLFRPAVLYRRQMYAKVETLLRSRTISGDFSIVAALMSASCHHHLGNETYAKALYGDIYSKASLRNFFNRDSTEFIRAYTLWAAERRIAHRTYDLEQVNFMLRDTFRVGGAEPELLESWMNAAEEGDAEAQWRLASAYFNGDGVEKDLDRALELWRQAESRYGEEPWVCRLRVLFYENDARIEEVYAERPDHKSGQACFIYGAYLKKRGGTSTRLEVNRRGMELGHFGCEIAYLRLSNPGIRRLLVLPRIWWVMAKAIRIGWRNENDPRWKI